MQNIEKKLNTQKTGWVATNHRSQDFNIFQIDFLQFRNRRKKIDLFFSFSFCFCFQIEKRKSSSCSERVHDGK